MDQRYRFEPWEYEEMRKIQSIKGPLSEGLARILDRLEERWKRYRTETYYEVWDGLKTRSIYRKILQCPIPSLKSLIECKAPVAEELDAHIYTFNSRDLSTNGKLSDYLVTHAVDRFCVIQMERLLK